MRVTSFTQNPADSPPQGGRSDGDSHCPHKADTGCETKNRSFFVKKGMSVTAYTEYGLVRKGMQLLHNSGKKNAMQRAQHRGMEKHSAEKIYQFVKAKI